LWLKALAWESGAVLSVKVSDRDRFEAILLVKAKVKESEWPAEGDD
jgi:hypothetical protein